MNDFRDQDEHFADETANKILWAVIQRTPELKNQIDAIFNSHLCDIEPDFLGFLGAYAHLSLFIPKNRVIYDMGCAYATQAWFFREHVAYIGVDLLTPVENRLHLPNTQHDHCSIKDWISKNSIINPHFAICNYTPPWAGGSATLVKEAFTDVFSYYPRNGPDDEPLTIKP